MACVFDILARDREIIRKVYNPKSLISFRKKEFYPHQKQTYIVHPYKCSINISKYTNDIHIHYSTYFDINKRSISRNDLLSTIFMKNPQFPSTCSFKIQHSSDSICSEISISISTVTFHVQAKATQSSFKSQHNYFIAPRYQTDK